MVNGVERSRINRPGAIRLWEKVLQSAGYWQYISQGYYVDPPPEYLSGAYITGWWDLSDGYSQSASAFGTGASSGMITPYVIPNIGLQYEGWLDVTNYLGYPQLWRWYNSNWSGNVDPPAYWVDTSYSTYVQPVYVYYY